MDNDAHTPDNARYRETMIEKIFTFKLHQFAVEERLGHRFSFFMINAYFAILLISFVNPKEILRLSHAVERIATAAAVPLFLYLLTFAAVLLAAISMTNAKSNSPCQALRVFCYLKLVTIYIVFPATNLIYLRVIADSLDPYTPNGHSFLVIGLGYLYVIAFGTAALFCLATLRNDYPTRGSLNVPTPLSESLLYILMSFIQFEQQMRDRPYMVRTNAGIDALQYIFTAGLTLVAMRYSVFWNFRLNKLYLVYTCQLLALRIYFNHVVANLEGSKLTSSLVLVFPLLSFIGRLSENMVFHVWSFRIALNNRGVDYDRYVTVFTYDLLREQLKLDKLDAKERELLTMLKHSARATKNFRSSKMASSFEEPLEPALLYLNDLSNDKLTKTESIYTLLKLKMLFVKQSLSSLTQTVSLLRKKIGKKALISFEYFHIRALLQIRMGQLYSGEIEDAEYERTTLGDIYDTLSSGAAEKDSASTKTNIDLNRVFDAKNNFEKLVEKINLYIDTKIEVFSRLYDSKVIGMKYMFSSQKALYLLGNEIDNEFTQLANKKDTPPYVLAAALSYNLKVKYQVRQADFFFKKYRVLLSKLQLSNRQLKNISQDSIGYDSVIFKVDISKSYVGRILDITPGYKEHLGEVRDDRGVIGLNINTLFPGSMAADHTEMMMKLDNLKTFNVQSEGMINGFDGYLRNVSYYVKLYGSISGEVSSIAWIRIRDQGLSSSILVDERYNIMSTDESFSQMIRVLGLPHPLPNLQALSDGLCQNAELVKYLDKNPDSQKMDFEKIYLRWREDVKEIYKGFGDTGIVHKIKPPPDGITRTMYLASNLGTFEFNKKRYFKLMVTLDVAQNDKALRNLKTLVTHRGQFIRMQNSFNFDNSNNISNQNNSSSNVQQNSETYDNNDSMEIATVYSNLQINYIAEAATLSQVLFEEILLDFCKLDDTEKILPIAVEKGFPGQVAQLMSGYLKTGLEQIKANNSSLNIIASEYDLSPQHHMYLKSETKAKSSFPDILQRISLLQGDQSQKSLQGSSIIMSIPQKRGGSPKDTKNSPPPQSKQPATPDLLKLLKRIPETLKDQQDDSPTTRRDLITDEGHNTQASRRAHKDTLAKLAAKEFEKSITIKTRQVTKPSPEQAKGGKMPTPIMAINKGFRSTALYTMKSLGQLGIVSNANSGPRKIKAQEENVMFSFFPPNVEKLMRTIVSYSNRVTRKHADDGIAGAGSMGSRSTVTTNSRNTTVFRRVNSTIMSHKRVSSVYILIFGLIFISCIYIGLFQYLNSLLSTYNDSNISCMVFLTYFVSIDRAMLTGALSLDANVEFMETINDETEFDRVSNVIKDAVNVTEPLPYLINNVKNSANAITTAMNQVEKSLSTLTNKQNEESIVSLMSHNRNYRLIDKYAAGEHNIVEISQHSISWWKLLSTIVFNFKYTVEYSTLLYNEAVSTNHQLTSDDMVRFEYLLKLKIEFARLVYEDNLGYMKGIMEEAMDYMITKDHENHFYQIYSVLYAGGAIVVVMLCYLYFMSMQNSKKLFELVDSYGLLKIWELHAMLEDLADEQSTYSKLMYHEVHLVNKYVEFNSAIYVGINNSRVINLQQNFARDKMRIRFRRDFMPTSIKFGIFAAVMSIILYGIILLMVQVFSSKNEERIVMERSIMKLHASLIDVEANFLNTVLYVNYGDFLKIANHTPSENYYESSIQTSIALMMDLRADIQDYFGTSEGAVLLQLLFDEMCEFFVSVKDQNSPSIMNDYRFCKGLNPALTLKGLVGFLQAEKQFLDDIRMQLERDRMDMIIASRTAYVEGAREIFYSVNFLTYRAAHRRFIDLFYTKVIPVTVNRVQQIRNNLEYIVGTVIYFCVVVLYLLMALTYALTFYYQAQDLRYFYEIFALIDPLFLVNNKYLFNKMRDSYNGII